MRNITLASIVVITTVLSTFLVNAQHIGNTSSDKAAENAAQISMKSKVFERQPIQVNQAEYVHVIDDMQKMLHSVQGITGALADQDWRTVKKLSTALSPQGEVDDKDPASISFHKKIPAGWRELGSPMKKGFGALAEEATNGKRTDVALKLLSQSLTQCVACHSTYALKVGP